VIDNIPRRKFSIMKTGNKEEKEMNSKNLLNILRVDRQLLAMFSGILFSFVIMISLAVTAGIWYL
jgi:hypothetical protein